MIKNNIQKLSLKKAKIIFEIKESGAPYPHECWVRIKTVKGRVMFTSELGPGTRGGYMIALLLEAIKSNRYKVTRVKPG